MKLARLLLPFLLLALSINNAAAEDTALDPAQEQFFSQFRTAIQGENVPQLMLLTHPQARACINEEGQEEYYSLILKNLVQILGRQQIIKAIKSRKVEEQEIKERGAAAAQYRMAWPIPPEQQLFITYDKDGSESTATIDIARDQDQWKWVHLCPQR